MKRIIVMLLLTMLSAAGWGAMTRNDICIEQNRFYQGSTLANTQRGCTIWSACDFENNIWQGWRLAPNPSVATDAVTCWLLKGHWLAKFYAGTYIPAVYDNATYGKPAELTYSGAWTDQAIYATNFAVTNELWHSVYRAASDRTVTVAVPADTTHLYMYCPYNVGVNANTTMTVSTDGDASTLVKSSWTMSSDFGTWTGYMNNNYALVATNCGGDNITFVRGAAGTLYIAGWIAVNKNTTAQPDTGVYDPITLINLFPDLSQADGPIYLKFGAAGVPFFWGAFHWTANQTAINESEAYTYDTSSAYNATYTFTNNTWLRTIASEFRRTLTADIQVKNGAAAAAEVGDYVSTYKFRPDGLQIDISHTFDAEAGTEDLRIPGSTGGNWFGGYAGKWNLPSQFTTARHIANQKLVSIAPPYDDSVPVDDYGVGVEAFAPSLDLSAYFSCRSNVYNVATTGALSKISIIKASSGAIPKIYKYLCGADDIDLANTDKAYGTQLRQVYPITEPGGYIKNPTPRRLTHRTAFIREN